ncbi:hypothetical protein [Ancylobacter polymorphus]|uniref:Uncharacterized protein n=1 Tax=Ancylobacter polymorphus TaxID=223390 RepID=A0ABU0BHM4_9HYPH|nr:hypothetical protein [Ancylobacter polymorphus]MDQ0305343.1 hypothetical protein [Ancylobacter polymorphus]
MRAILSLLTAIFFATVSQRGTAETFFEELQYKGTPEFTFGCDFEKNDAFGEARRNYCWMTVNNTGKGRLIGSSQILNIKKIVEIDAKGLRLVKPTHWDECGIGAPKRMAVDGVRIDKMDIKNQIKTMKSGNIFVREEQALWPYCGISPYATSLQGFGEALDSMISAWETRPK